jgi:glucokinase
VYLGIEIGATKLQLGVGAGDGVLAGLWRGGVNIAEGPEGIRRQIMAAVPELLAGAGVERSRLRGVGIGFGGPVDDATRTIIKSHQIEGWDGFPLADWLSDLVGLPAALGNDADVAGLAEALHGAGKGLSPIFYITVGSGIGGGLILNGAIYRGVGHGAAEIGHLKMCPSGVSSYYPYSWARDAGIVEETASGWGIEKMVEDALWRGEGRDSLLLRLVDKEREKITTKHVAQAAEAGDAFALSILEQSWDCLALAICQVIALLCPRRIVIGGGVSLMGEKVFFEPLQRLVAERVFKPFAGLTDIVPAALGEEVVVHGALALVRKQFER